MFAECFDGIIRTGRGIAAIFSNKRGKGVLVNFNPQDEKTTKDFFAAVP